MLEGIATGYIMLPQDWKDLMRMLLSPAQYVVFESEFKHSASALSDPQHTANQLYGAGQYNDITAQATLTPVHFSRTATCVQRAFRKVPVSGQPLSSFVNIKQQHSEPYHQFIDRLKESVTRQIDNTTAQNELMRKLAFENANTDCKKALQSIIHRPKYDLADMIQACADEKDRKFFAFTVPVLNNSQPTERGVVAWKQDEEWHSLYTLPQKSAQRSELAAAVKALHHFSKQPLNLVVDSLYVANVITRLQGSYVTILPAEQLLEAKCFLASDLAVESTFEPLDISHLLQEFSSKAVEVEVLLEASQKITPESTMESREVAILAYHHLEKVVEYLLQFPFVYGALKLLPA
ncbi:retrovirus group K member 113 Gag polyproteinpolyprotein-like-like [Podarcis lilfordi]|uniref:Retrovirus group K member 113 Gag polyproteinpolyprotein-like-like n=1 Tax=Podarcis lilfordi TaxID=74358 RepID=A0AA35PS69_9SAUR|nr:retrovirus group K member 113 Gag polyproteinpolyprotein-like-like [Podarcis lilfordi]